MKLNLYNQEAKQIGEVELSDKIFGAAYKPALIKQVILAILANARRPVAHTKDRGDVSGGGKKPWRQKGTGRARHGSIRSPIWVGGGVAHGPRNEKDYSQKVNKKMKKAALASALSAKVRENELLLVDSLNFEEPKTKLAKEILNAFAGLENFEKLAYKKKNAALIVLPDADALVEKSFANFGNVEVKDARNINTYDVFKYKYIIVVKPEETEKVLLERLS